MMVAAVAVVTSAFGGQQYNWQAVDNDFSGSWDDPAHWKTTPATGTYPGVWDENESTMGDHAWFDFRGNNQDGLTPEITFPEGTMTNLASFIYRTIKSVVTVFNGTNTVLVMPKPTKGGTWGGTGVDKGISFLVGASTGSRMFYFDGWTGPATLKNFKIRFNNDSTDERRVTFESGDYDFSNAGSTMWFFEQSVNDSEKNAVVEIGSAATVTADVAAVGLNCPSLSNVLRIRGKAQFPQSVKMPVKTQNVCVDSAVERFAGIEVDGGELDFGTSWSSGVGMTMGLAYDAKYPKYGSSTSCVFRLSANAGVLRQTESRYSISSIGPGRHQLMLSNGSVGSFAGSIALGCAALSTGEVSVVDSTASFAKGLSLGGAVADAASGSFEAAGSTVTFGGSLSISNGRVTLGNGAHVVLSGASAIVGDASLDGTRTFAADGATIEVGTSSAPVNGFDSAILGAKGLEIVSGGDLTLTQPFASAADETGVLVLSTSGDVSFAAPAEVVVVATNGGCVAFGGQADADHPLRGLSLGAAGRQSSLTFVPNETVCVEGAAELSGALSVRLSGAWALGDTARIRVSSPVSDETWTAWELLCVSEGLPEGLTWKTDVETADATDLILTVIEDVPITVNVSSGTDTHATNITFGVGQTLAANVSKDARAEFAGDVKYGRFEKTGAGAVDLSGANLFMKGVLLDGGLLSVAGLDSLGVTDASAAGLTLADGTLEIRGAGEISGGAEFSASQGENGMVIIKNEADVTMPIPSATQGAFTKRGKGRLTLEVAEDTDWKALRGNDMKSLNGESIAWDDANGTAPTTANRYGAVNVAEGELVFRSRGDVPPTVTVTSEEGTDIGLAGRPCAADFAQPGLVLDHVRYFLSGGSESDFEMGVKLAPGTSSIRMPYLVITNGATLQCASFMPAWRSTDAVPVSVLMDNGTLDIRYQFSAVECSCTDENGGASVTNVYTVRNGSAIYSRYKEGRMFVNGRNVVMDFDGSVLARNEDGETVEMTLAQRPGLSAALAFRNGSYLALGGVWSGSTTQSQTKPVTYPIRLSFDDSEWFVGAGDRDIPSSNMNVIVTATGRGLKLNPPEGSRWRLYTRVSGTGGIVKGGAGTLFVDNWYRYFEYQDDPVTLACTGTNVVTGGILEMRPTAIAPEAKFAFEGAGGVLRLVGEDPACTNVSVCGTGTLGNGLWVNLRVLSRYGKELTIDGAVGAALDGAVIFDFEGDADEAMRFAAEPVVVVRWTGSAPDVSKWKTRNTGVGGKLVFTVGDDGTVSAQWKKNGLVIMVR